MTTLADAIIEAVAMALGARMARIISEGFDIEGNDGPLVELKGHGIDEAIEALAHAAVLAAARKLIELGPSADMVVAAYNCERNGGSLPDCLAAYLSQLKIEIEGTKS